MDICVTIWESRTTPLGQTSLKRMPNSKLQASLRIIGHQTYYTHYRADLEHTLKTRPDRVWASHRKAWVMYLAVIMLLLAKNQPTDQGLYMSWRPQTLQRVVVHEDSTPVDSLEGTASCPDAADPYRDNSSHSSGREDGLGAVSGASSWSSLSTAASKENTAAPGHSCTRKRVLKLSDDGWEHLGSMTQRRAGGASNGGSGREGDSSGGPRHIRTKGCRTLVIEAGYSQTIHELRNDRRWW
ncbi:hypothetical protein V8F06_003129 [Rhypophila decipiens]